MVQRSCGTRFATQTFECTRIVGKVVGQKLEGDETAKLLVLSFVDNTHPAVAQFLADAIVRDGLADHECQSKSVAGGACLCNRSGSSWMHRRRRRCAVCPSICKNCC